MPAEDEPIHPGPQPGPDGASPIAILTVFACLACALGLVVWLVLRPPGSVRGPVPPPPPPPAAPVFLHFAVEWKETSGFNSESRPRNLRVGRVAFQDGGFAYVRATASELDLRAIRENTGGADEIPLPGAVWGGLTDYRIRFERSTGGGSAEDCTKIFETEGDFLLLRFPRGSLVLDGVPEVGALGRAFDPNPAGIARLSALPKFRKAG